MRINNFVRRDYKTVSPLDRLESFKTNLLQEQALVVKNNDKYYGILTPFDLLGHSCKIAANCINKKPIIKIDQSLYDALNVMKENNYEVLEVFKDTEFCGLLYKNDIVEFLIESNDEKDQIIHDIAHDLKNPIASIQGMVELIKMNNDPDKSELYHNYILQACDESYSIINNLLELASLKYDSSQEFKYIDINLLLNEFVSKPFYLADKKNVTIDNEISSERWIVHIHPQKIIRALQNLVINGIKFSHSGDRVTISSFYADDSVVISVKDQGIGIPDKLQSEVFKKFSKARRKGTNGEKSTGLGLAITQEIIKANNGNIWLNSEENVGTTFYVSLPRSSVNDQSAIGKIIR